MKKAAISLALFAALAAGACRFLLPERFAVNAPMIHQMLGRGGVDAPAESSFGTRITVPPGYSIGLYASGIANARFLHPTSNGDLLVSVPRSGRVILLAADADGDGRTDGARDLLTDLDRPHGLELHAGWLYVAEGDAIGRVRFDADRGATQGAYTRIVEGLPNGGNHWSKTVRIGPDGWMYVSVGSSCNVCEDEPRRAAMLRFRPDGSGEEVFATGLRNSVGFDWRPGANELYATENGRDLLGNDFPPCELNRLVAGGFYGWPYANGDRVEDPDVGALQPERARDSIAPAHAFRAHNAPLGITFLRSRGAPDGYREAALVALHGSWNRTHKDGYKVVSLHWAPDGSIEERDFAVGFEQNDHVIGRPVDVAEAADGTIFISDDYAGSVYRVVHERQSSAKARATPAPIAAIPAPEDLGSPEQRAERSARGRSLYDRFDCGSCHEAERAAPGVTPIALSALPARYSASDLVAFLATPTPPMPLFPMDSEERRDLAVFLLER